MRIVSAIFTCVVLLPSTTLADCYGIAMPSYADRVRAVGTAPNLDEAHAHDCQTVKTLVECGIHKGDAVALVTNRRSIEGYIAQIIASCAAARVRAAATPAPAAPGQSAPWLADMNRTKSGRTGIEDGFNYCQSIVAGNETPRASFHVRDCLAWYGESILRPDR